MCDYIRGRVRGGSRGVKERLEGEELREAGSGHSALGETSVRGGVFRELLECHSSGGRQGLS